MSTFQGLLNESVFKGCAIDYFQGDVLKSCKVFFLSHFHTDHMKGIYDAAFNQMFIKDSSLLLYCSKISRKLLLKNRLMEIPAVQIVAMDKDPIDVCPNDCSIRVTPLRAGHCPGSMMLLFESCGVTALYTGDFRITKKDLSRCKPLHNEEDGKVIQINSLYLDTTFAHCEYVHFPTREQSRDNIIRLIKGRHESIKYVSLDMPAKTGIEYLMVELYQEFQTPIHVSDALCQEILSCIDQLIHVTTSELKKSFIHFCHPNYKGLGCSPCPKKEPNLCDDVLTIKPSAQFFHRSALKVGEVLQESDKYFRVAYSSHASLSELVEFIAYLKPHNIYPSVISGDQTAEEVMQEISMYAICEMGLQI
uniref:Protein artemis n=1 Tax=Lygus hesperus TaxID=30085 RepID=A0A0A9YZA3_LYGHE